MAPTKRPNDHLLARVNFPLYSVEMLTNRHCLVAGGGGSAKTGVANGFVSNISQLGISSECVVDFIRLNYVVRAIPFGISNNVMRSQSLLIFQITPTH